MERAPRSSLNGAFSDTRETAIRAAVRHDGANALDRVYEAERRVQQRARLRICKRQLNQHPNGQELRPLAEPICYTAIMRIQRGNYPGASEFAYFDKNIYEMSLDECRSLLQCILHRAGPADEHGPMMYRELEIAEQCVKEGGS